MSEQMREAVGAAAKIAKNPNGYTEESVIVANAVLEHDANSDSQKPLANGAVDIEEMVKKHKANYWMYTTPEHVLRAALTDMASQYEKAEYEEGTLGHTIGIPYKSAAACRVERLEQILIKLIAEFDKDNYGIRNIDAPGHSHDIPGVWDDDNGDMSGKQCDLCAAWREACAVHDACSK